MAYRYVKAPQKTDVSQGGKAVIWAQEKKLETLKYFLSSGNLIETSVQCRVPHGTLRGWQRQDWWKDGTKEYREGNETQLDAKLTKAIDTAIEHVLDRLENGNTVYDPKTGKQRVVPAPLREVNATFNTLLEKRQLIRKQPTKIIEQTTTATQLENLAKQFSEFVTGQIKEENAADIIELVEGDTVMQNEDGVWEIQDGTV
jgi:hypothetical protein